MSKADRGALKFGDTIDPGRFGPGSFKSLRSGIEEVATEFWNDNLNTEARPTELFSALIYAFLIQALSWIEVEDGAMDHASFRTAIVAVTDHVIAQAKARRSHA